jgi:hypothetical protein
MSGLISTMRPIQERVEERRSFSGAAVPPDFELEELDEIHP